MEENKNLDPMKLLFGMMVESSLVVGQKLSTLIHKYEANNIDVVPISELKEIIAQGMRKTMEEGSLTNHLLGEGLNG